MVEADGFAEFIGRWPTDVGLSLDAIPILERKIQCIEEGYLQGPLSDEDGRELLRHRCSITQGNDACFGEVAPSGTEASLSLVDGVIVGQRRMGDAGFAKVGCPARIGTEDVLLVHRRKAVGEGTFEIDDDCICMVEVGLHFGKEIGNPAMLGNRAYSAVEEHIAHEQN